MNETAIILFYFSFACFLLAFGRYDYENFLRDVIFYSVATVIYIPFLMMYKYMTRQLIKYGYIIPTKNEKRKRKKI